MDSYQRKCKITDHQFLENSRKKSGEILHWEKRRLSEYVTKIINNLLSNAILNSFLKQEKDLAIL